MIYEKIPTDTRLTASEVAAWTIAAFVFGVLGALVLFCPEALVNIWVQK
jgi:hypothetical protein